MKSPTIHIIAEAGTNHDGDPLKAAGLIDMARRSGADSVKFQIIYPESLYAEWLWVDDDLQRNPVIEARRQQQLTDEDWVELSAYSEEMGIEFAASVFDTRGIDLLMSVGAPYVKIASTDLNNGHLLRPATRSGLPLVVSTGMSTLSEIREAARLIEANGAGERTTFLHCVSEYPCPERNAGISFLETLRNQLERPIGYSDHTEGCGAAAAAVALGATVIEKHITHDRAGEGFDHHYAMEEPEFTSYVRTIREAAEALTPKPEKLSEAERATALRARRGVYARRDVALGEVLTESDLLVVRPPTSLRPNEAEAIIGRRTRVSLKAFEALTFDQFES